jgi:radical SAM superfamily enzyme YgiQ (UPF0313 family)
MSVAVLDREAAGVDRHKAFAKFVSERSLSRPSELILIQPALVPEAFFDVTTARKGGYYNFPPVGLLYLAAAARHADPDLTVKIIDVNHSLLEAAQKDGFHYGMWRDLVRDALAGCRNPHVAVTYMFGTTKPCFTEVVNFIREEFPNLPILSGGVQATFDFEEILRDGLCDIVARREGENQLVGYLQHLAGDETALPHGMAFIQDGALVELGKPDENNPVNWDIRPSYDLIDIETYSSYGSLGAFSRFVGEEKRFATVLATRGCRARCTFCTVRNFNGFGLRQRDVQDVVDEIKYLVQEKGVHYIDWLDDDLLWDPKRTVDLFKTMAEQLPNFEWTASNGLIAVAVDEEVMHWMVKSGLRAFKIGVESGNDKMLKTIKKPTTKAKLLDRAKLFAKYPEVLFSANFIIGFPNETFGEMMDSFNFAGALRSDWGSFYICQPLKGTDMFSSFQALGDSRTKEERYGKVINPGRSAERGEFGYQFAGQPDEYAGWDIFNIPLDVVPSIEQQKEIWFSFNLVGNFLANPNFGPGGNPPKLAQWLESIHSGYPYDASMAAALTHAYFLAGDLTKFRSNQAKFLRLLDESAYWRKRVCQFPELLLLAHIEERPSWLPCEIPTTLVRPIATQNASASASA